VDVVLNYYYDKENIYIYLYKSEVVKAVPLSVAKVANKSR